MTLQRIQHPGYRATWTPTTGWDSPGGPFHWSRYTKREEDGWCLREDGFADSLGEARLWALRREEELPQPKEKER